MTNLLSLCNQLILLPFQGEDLQSAASMKLQVLKTCIDLVEALLCHVRKLYHLPKEVRDTLIDHYNDLSEELKCGQGKLLPDRNYIFPYI